MRPAIKLLPQDVSTRIAAGEVIERPSSVCKEMLENSIDAGASSVSVQLLQGGKVSIVVEDDGAGIPYDELPLAITRYATSKISSVDDLERIKTLGYRGEALASIAAVSHMEIRSRTHENSGNILRASAGEITLHSPMPCSRGTRIEVSEIFFNLPARLKFLRASASETRRIVQIVQDYALVYPRISFSVTSEGRKILNRAPCAGVQQSAEALWGDSLQHMSVTRGEVTVSIWWSGPGGKGRCAVFVNHRRVQDGTVRAALAAAGGTTGGDWLVCVSLPPEDLDVNVHPTKMEVRFRRSGDVYEAVRTCASNLVEGQIFGVMGGPPVLRDQPAAYRRDAGTAGLFSEPPPGSRDDYGGGQFTQRDVPIGAVSYGAAGFLPHDTSAERDFSGPPPESLHMRYMGQCGEGYLFFDTPSGLMAVDPHAAHERILYEELCAAPSGNISQMLAVKLAIPQAIAASLEPVLDTLTTMGFRFSASPESGGVPDEICGVPMALVGQGAIDLLRAVLAGDDVAEPDRVRRRLASRACKGAVKLGGVLAAQEADMLMHRLMKCNVPNACPHGRPTCVLISWQELTVRFKR